MKNISFLSGLLLLSLTFESQAYATVNIHTLAPNKINPHYVYSEDTLSHPYWLDKKDSTKLFFGLNYDFINDPIIELNPEKTLRTNRIVDGIHSINLNFGYGINQKSQIGLTTAFSSLNYPSGTNETGLTDTRLFGKFRINETSSPITLAFIPEMSLPTGSRKAQLSTETIGGGFRFSAEKDFKSVLVAMNLGYLFFGNAKYRDYSQKQSMPVSLSSLIPVGSRFGINTEVASDLSLPLSNNQNAGAAYLGGRYIPNKDVTMFAGAALGAITDHSSADYRIVFGASFTPDLSKPDPIKPEPIKVVEVVKTPEPIQEKKPELPPVPKQRVTFTPKEVIVAEEVKFKQGKAILVQSGKDLLDEVAKTLKLNKKNFKTIIVEGHTNKIGSKQYNQKLSEQRAAAVREYLVSRGVPAKKIKSVGYGFTKPKDGLGLSKEAQLEADRRVEFKVIQ